MIKLTQQEYEDLLLKKDKTEEEKGILDAFERGGIPTDNILWRIGKNGMSKVD